MGGGRASKRQTNSFFPFLSNYFIPGWVGVLVFLFLNPLLFSRSEHQAKPGASGAREFAAKRPEIEILVLSGANPAAGGVSGAKQLECWRLAVSSR